MEKPGIFGGIFQVWQCLDVPKALCAKSSTSVCVCGVVVVFVCVEGFFSQLIRGLLRQNEGLEQKRDKYQQNSKQAITGSPFLSLSLFPSKRMCSKRILGSETGSTVCDLR